MMKTKTLLIVLLTNCLMPAAALMADSPLPTGPKVVAGDISITNPTPSQLLVQQSGAAGIVDWGSFSIGAGNGVQFNNGNGATLNRVTGGNLSSIMGTLSATGSVYLINQNGIVFGETGAVNTVGTFVASTLDISNRDFLAGGEDVFAGGSDAYVINLGRISALGGDVALLGRNVWNKGVIVAPDGTVGLVAGREILMRDASLHDGLFSVHIGGSDSSVTDAGAIRAAAAELRANGGNVYALAGNTEGTIAATGVTKVKGRIFLTAGDGGNVRVDKPVKATGTDGKGGQIVVSGGAVEMAGVLDATGTVGGEVRITSAIETVFSGNVLAFGTGMSGTGGIVEVSGRHLTYDGTVNTGGGTVLIDPDNIEITNGSTSLTGATVLTTTDVTDLLTTGDLIIMTSGTNAEAGTIVVSSAVNATSQFVLTLLAQGDILTNASIQVGDASGGGLNLIAGWDGVTSKKVFHPSVFDNADLATQTIFGNSTGTLYFYNGARHFASGSVFIGDRTLVSGVAVGAFSGDTRVYANDLAITGSTAIESSSNFAQLGYNVTGLASGVSLNSAITVRATGNVTLRGGSSGQGAVQIGNVGLNTLTPTSAVLVSSEAAITIEAIGDLSLIGGSSSGSDYAMVGNGSSDTTGFQSGGDRAGNITISLGGELSLEPATADQGLSFIGHATSNSAITNADIAITAAAYDADSTTAVGAGGTGTLDIGMMAIDLMGGNFTAVATDSSLSLSGTTASNSCDCNFIISPHDLVVQASGNIDLQRGFLFSNTGGGDVALAAGANFSNNSGADAFSAMMGRWLIYSGRPDHNQGDIGVLDARALRYNTLYDSADPFLKGSPGNRLIYSVRPVVEVADASMTYGGTLLLPGLQMTVNGTVVDAASFGLSLDGTFVDLTKVTVSPSGFVNAGAYATALDANLSALTSVVNVIGVLTDFGQLTVDQIVVTGSVIGAPSKVYDGSTLASLTSADFALSGFVTGEGATVSQGAGTYATANAAGSDLVTVNLGRKDFTADAGTLLTNYVLPTLVSGDGVITRAQLLVSIVGLPTKAFDGTDFAALSATNFLLTGFAAGEDATITQTRGTFAASGVGKGNTVTVTLTDSDYAAGRGTLLSNYILPSTASGLGFIDNAPLPQPTIPEPQGLETFVTTPLGAPAGPATGLELISTETTQRILDEINAGSAFCKALVKQEYVIDCLSDRLQAVANGLSAVGEYSEVRAALEDAAQKLHALVLANASDDLARTIARAANLRSSRPLTAISSAVMGAANAQAAAIIDGARLVLLRSSSGSERRSVAFTQVAQVVNSTKVLLRSS